MCRCWESRREREKILHPASLPLPDLTRLSYAFGIDTKKEAKVAIVTALEHSELGFRYRIRSQECSHCWPRLESATVCR